MGGTQRSRGRALRRRRGDQPPGRSLGGSFRHARHRQRVETLLADADLWITSALDERDWDRRVPVELYAAYRAGQGYHNRKRMRSERDAWDWNETAINRPDLALADLVSLLHPGFLPDHELYFFAPVSRQ